MYTKKEFNKRRYQKYADRIPYSPDINILSDGTPNPSNPWAEIIAYNNNPSGSTDIYKSLNNQWSQNLDNLKQQQLPQLANHQNKQRFNPFSKGNIGNTLTSLAPAVGGIAGNLISDGYSSGAGNFMQGISGLASAIPGPWGAAIGAGLNVVGGLVNRAFGTKVDQQKLNEVNNNIAYMNNFNSTANNFDDVKGPQHVSMDTNVYKDGWFTNSASGKNNALKNQLLTAVDFAQRGVDNNISNLKQDQTNNMLMNYAALGGDIQTQYKNGQEVDLSLKDIEKLIDQGYDIEYVS